MRDGWSVVLVSLGRASSDLMEQLAELSGLSAERTRDAVFCAPSIVSTGLTQSNAERIAYAIQRTGADAEPLAPDEPLDHPPDDLAASIVLRDFENASAVQKELSHLLGISLDRAEALICHVPSVALERATANGLTPLRNRLARMSVEIDVSKPAEAIYDVYLGPCSASDRQLASNIVTQVGLEPPPVESKMPRIVAGVEFDLMKRLEGLFDLSALPIRILNRDFQRFDLRLDRISGMSRELKAFLASTLGGDTNQAERVLGRLPVVTHRQLPYSETVEHLKTYVGLGANATPVIIALQSFSLHIDGIGDPARTTRVLTGLGRQTEDAARQMVRGSGVLEGPFTYSAARWLQHSLEAAGCRVRLDARRAGR